MQFDIKSPVFEKIGTVSLSMVPGNEFGGTGFFPYNYTGAKDELLACRETAWLCTNLSQSPVYDIHGKEVIKFLNYYCVNSDFAGTKDNKGRHVLMCNDKGQLIADGVLIKISENHFRTYWLAPVIAVLAQASGMDVQGEFVDEYFYQIDGPKSLEILEKASRSDLHDLKFAGHKMAKIDGKDVRILRLGMSGALAYEAHGPAKDADPVYAAIKEAGREFGIKPLGNRHYCVNHTQAGYPNQFIHFIYPYTTSGEFLAQALGNYMNFRLPGSCMEDMECYFVTPFDVKWDYLINYDHDFVGKETLLKLKQNPPQTCVTLEWNPVDVAEVYASQFSGMNVEPYEDISGPKDWGEVAPTLIGFRVDRVLSGGKMVGRASGRINDYYHRRVISLAFIDREYAKEGTEVTVLWGTPGTPMKEIRAKVAAFPYYNEEYRNETFDVEKIPHPRFK